MEEVPWLSFEIEKELLLNSNIYIFLELLYNIG
jgi:hypothetical protein